LAKEVAVADWKTERAPEKIENWANEHLAMLLGRYRTIGGNSFKNMFMQLGGMLPEARVVCIPLTCRLQDRLLSPPLMKGVDIGCFPTETPYQFARQTKSAQLSRIEDACELLLSSKAAEYKRNHPDVPNAPPFYMFGITSAPVDAMTRYFKNGFDSFNVVHYDDDCAAVEWLETVMVRLYANRYGCRNKPRSGGERPPWTRARPPWMLYLAIGCTVR
jgi:hypothetical protein